MIFRTLIIFILTATVLFAQGRQDDEKDSRSKGYRSYFSEKTESDEIMPGIFLNPENYILDSEISPDDYLVGPGDQFDLYIGGVMQKHVPLTVIPDGSLILPDLGTINVSGLTITQSEQALKNLLKGYYKTEEIKLLLIHIRKFRVYVSWQIKEPGVYFLQNTDRVSSVIQQSGGMLSWSDPSRIEIIRGDTTITANLWAFFYKGELKGNPFLQQGDIVKVPPIDLTKPYVKVNSTRGSEQYVPILEKEELKHFLDRTNLIGKRSDISNIEYIHHDSTFFINIMNPERPALILSKGDQITIPVIRGEVFVTGQVLRPGSYVHVPEYTAWDYITQAGILETSEDIGEVKVIHFANKEVEYGTDVVVESGDIVFLGRKTREDIKDYINILVPVLTLVLTVFLAFGK